MLAREAIGLAVALTTWVAAVELVVRARSSLFARAEGPRHERTLAYLQTGKRTRYVEAAIGKTGEGLAWMAAFGVIFGLLARAAEPLWGQLGMCGALAGLWTSSEYARSLNVVAQVGADTSGRRRSIDWRNRLWLGYWASRLVMWLAFLAVACFAGRFAARLV